MEIKPKFDVGDEVFIVNRDTMSNYLSVEQKTITRVKIEAGWDADNEYKLIYYKVDNERYVGEHSCYRDLNEVEKD